MLAPCVSAPASSLAITNPLEVADWDKRLSSHPESTFFHGAAWARVLADTYGFQPVYLADSTETRLNVLLPMMEVKSLLKGTRGVSLPFTDACPALLANDASFQNLFHEALETGKRRGWRSLEFRGGECDSWAQAPSVEFYGHELDLSPGLKKLEAGLKSPVRRAIRKAERAGVHVETSTAPDAMRNFYRLHCRTRRQHGLPPQPFQFFQNIQRHILATDAGFIQTAFYKKIPVAAAVFFHFAGRAIYKFGASEKAFLPLRANNLVMWSAIVHCAERGMKSLDFGRTALRDQGLRRFKLGWGTRERKWRYFKYDLRQEAFAPQRDRASGWHNQVFRKMPLFLSRIFGELLYRHVA